MPSTITFVIERDGPFRADVRMPASPPPEEVRAMAFVLNQLAGVGRLAGILAAGVEEAALPPSVAAELEAAVDAGAGPAVSPLEVL